MKNSIKKPSGKLGFFKTTLTILIVRLQVFIYKAGQS